MIAHELRSKIEEMVVDPRMLIGLAGVSAVMALSGTASADDSRGHKNACRSSIVGTYLTTEEDNNGEFASRTLITFHRDGTMAVVDARQFDGLIGTAFSAQQGSYRCTGRRSAVATTVDFGFPPDQDIGRLDWRIRIAPDGSVEGANTVNLFTPLATCNPFDAEATCELEVQADFSFTSVRVPSEVD